MKKLVIKLSSRELEALLVSGEIQMSSVSVVISVDTKKMESRKSHGVTPKRNSHEKAI